MSLTIYCFFLLHKIQFWIDPPLLEVPFRNILRIYKYSFPIDWPTDVLKKSGGQCHLILSNRNVNISCIYSLFLMILPWFGIWIILFVYLYLSNCNCVFLFVNYNAFFLSLQLCLFRQFVRFCHGHFKVHKRDKKPWGPFDFDKSIGEKIATLHPKLILLLSQNGKTYQFLQVCSVKSPDQAQVTLQCKAYTPMITYKFPNIAIGETSQAITSFHFFDYFNYLDFITK